MSTDPNLLWTAKPPPASKPRRGELLFEFVRTSDRAPMTCELRFHGESYGWEAQFFLRGELTFSHGAFVTRARAVQWAERERDAMTGHAVSE
jgi:hypothetical protein